MKITGGDVLAGRMIAAYEQVLSGRTFTFVDTFPGISF
jgi:hypothetical protein